MCSRTLALFLPGLLTDNDLYCIPTATLRDASLSEADLASRVEGVAETVVTDGMIADAEGDLYHTALEHDAVMRCTPSGELETVTVVRSDELMWPDCFAWGSDGSLFVTISMNLQDAAVQRRREHADEPYRVFRIDLADGGQNARSAHATALARRRSHGADVDPLPGRCARPLAPAMTTTRERCL